MAKDMHRLTGFAITVLLSLSALWSISTISFHYESYMGSLGLKAARPVATPIENSPVSGVRWQMSAVECEHRNDCQ
jgi:hypothetical protein